LKRKQKMNAFKRFACCASMTILLGCTTTSYHDNGGGSHGNAHVTRIAVLSVGDLEGKKIPMQGDVRGAPVKGVDGGTQAVLSKAVRAALDGTGYDTILDATVTTRVSRFWLFWFTKGHAEIEVSGYGVKSSDF
jgi:hypothetical protein